MEHCHRRRSRSEIPGVPAITGRSHRASVRLQSSLTLWSVQCTERAENTRENMLLKVKRERIASSHWRAAFHDAPIGHVPCSYPATCTPSTASQKCAELPHKSSGPQRAPLAHECWLGLVAKAASPPAHAAAP
eukprot:741965-Prymnesium_polylepis.1